MPKRNPSSTPSITLVDSWGRRNRKYADKPCAHCGETYRPKKESSRYCSRACSWANNGKNSKTVKECWWEGARGYIQGFVRVNGKKVSARQHRLIAEQKIGRPLLPTEDVHHINGDKKDNRPENLEVIDHSKHSVLSNASRSRRKGYKLALTDKEREMRSIRMKNKHRANPEIRMRLRNALAKAVPHE